MIFTKNLYKKARRHYVARAQEFLAIRARTEWDVCFGDYAVASREYRKAASMARKIVDRANREKDMYKYAVEKK